MGVLRLLFASALVCLSAAPAAAQYFGRNKVEYHDFDFRILASEHFDVYYYPREERAARLAVQLAERWYVRFSRTLNHHFDKRQPLMLYGSQAEFAQTNVVSGLLSDTIGGVTEGARRRIAMPFAPTLAETDRVLGHEIAHAFQFDIARRHGGGIGQPAWFVEGMAEYLARGATHSGGDRAGDLWLRDAVLSERLPDRHSDAARDFSPYQYGYAFWTYLAERFGDAVVEKSLKPGKKDRRLNDRIRHAAGVDLDTLYADWREYVTQRFAAAAERADPTQHVTRPTWPRDAFGAMQLGPSLSPDGRYAVFFSERDRFSLDLFLADLDRGAIVRKLATTTANARFDSLQPLRSAGTWSPDGESFAFAAVRQGHAALVIVDLQQRRPDREITFRDLGQVLSPAWSPDGNAIAFSALAGGFTDLYLYDLTTGALGQLTDDAFADLHPAWSPDGRVLAFATERYAGNLTSLTFTGTRLATIELADRRVAPLSVNVGGDHLNPQWSADARDLFFIADPGGASNIYRFDRETSTAHRVTEVATAVSGIAPTSPALSLASRAPVLAFTVYRNGRHRLSVLRGARAIAGSRVGDEAPLARALPGADDAQPGRHDLPAPASIATREYSSRLSLEAVGQPYVSSGGGPFGTFVRGGGSLLFGDMLGERRFGVAVQIGNHLRDAAVAVRYLNQQRRWTWGAIAELEPRLYRYRRSVAIDHDGQAAVRREADYWQQVQLRGAGLVAYPFNRGLRAEFTGGVRHAAFSREIRSQISSAESGRVLQQDRVQIAGGAPTTVGEISAALVGDTAVFGPTGALVGARYRLEVAPAIGSLAYTRVLADYRRYLMPLRPFTIALRALHSGRYGRGAGDARVLSSFLGSRSYVRGHSSDARDCRPEGNRVCGDDLLGSRMFVGNVEVRFPLWGLFAREIEYGPLPADGFLFADGGVIAQEIPGTTLRRRTAISSIGAGVRLSAAGLPLEMAAIRALDGPRPGWKFDLGFRVGF